MKDWSLALGICPGLLLGIRTYSFLDGYDHIVYIGCFMIIFSTYDKD